MPTEKKSFVQKKVVFSSFANLFKEMENSPIAVSGCIKLPPKLLGGGMLKGGNTGNLAYNFNIRKLEKSASSVLSLPKNFTIRKRV
jgi:hypothetical protein